MKSRFCNIVILLSSTFFINPINAQEYFLYNVKKGENLSKVLNDLKNQTHLEYRIYGKNGLINQHVKLNNLVNPDLVIPETNIKILSVLKPKAIETTPEIHTQTQEHINPIIPFAKNDSAEKKKEEESLVLLNENQFAGKIIFLSSTVKESGTSTVLNTSKKAQWGLGGTFQYNKLPNWKLLTDAQFIYISSSNPKLDLDYHLEEHFIYLSDSILVPGAFIGFESVPYLTADALTTAIPNAVTLNQFYAGGSLYFQTFAHPAIHIGYNQYSGLRLKGGIKFSFNYFDTEFNYQTSESKKNSYKIKDQRFEASLLTKEF